MVTFIYIAMLYRSQKDVSNLVKPVVQEFDNKLCYHPMKYTSWCHLELITGSLTLSTAFATKVKFTLQQFDCPRFAYF